MVKKLNRISRVSKKTARRERRTK